MNGPIHTWPPFATSLRDFLGSLTDPEGMGHAVTGEVRQRAKWLHERAGDARSCMSPTICTASGLEFAPFAPAVDRVRIGDIAHALSNLCRFGGHTTQFYSVAQHSVLVSYLVAPELAGYGLLHDASEAYLLDIPAPYKPLMAGYVEAEHRLQSVVQAAFGLDPSLRPESVHRADRWMLDAERHDLMPDCNWWPKRSACAQHERIVPLSPDDARRLFIDRYFELAELGFIRPIKTAALVSAQ